jgi:hypothetical protein
MKAISRAISMTLGAGVLAAVFVANAFAGCGDLSTLQGPFIVATAVPKATTELARPVTADSARSSASGATASIVGLWHVTLYSQGNGGHNPPIPDGAIIDFGMNAWHSDGTEILNSGGHSPGTGNFCLGVWGQTGFLTYELNHYALSYNNPTGPLSNIVNLHEQDTLSPSGDSYSGTFTLDVYDTMGNHVDHVVGTLQATRVTVDTLITSLP